MPKAKITTSLDVEDKEKLESIASENGLTASQLLGTIALKIARGGILAEVCLNQPDGKPLHRPPRGEHLRELLIRRSLEDLIDSHQGTNEELRKEAHRIGLEFHQFNYS